MKIATSVLDCKDRVKGVLELNRTNISYIHIDVMDGNFVPNVQFDNMGEIIDINLVTKYPMDVHLMVDNPITYIKELSNMNIEFITIHLEIDKDKREIFKSIRDLGYKVGLSIKPNTNVNDIIPYLDEVDLVLVMSVEPGLGGQSFMEGTVNKINKLKELIGARNILIEVDGGINGDIITKIKDVDIAVVGSYITRSDNYYKSVEELLITYNKAVDNYIDKSSETAELAINNELIMEDDLKIKIKLYELLFKIGILIGFFPLIVSLSLFPILFLFNSAQVIIEFWFEFWPFFGVGILIVIYGWIKLKRLSN